MSKNHFSVLLIIFLLFWVRRSIDLVISPIVLQYPHDIFIT